jgi:hypothetical protein
MNNNDERDYAEEAYNHGSCAKRGTASRAGR